MKISVAKFPESLSVAILVVATILLSGCGAAIRRAVNKQFPPVSPERRQLAAIQAAQKGLETLGDPNGYVFIPATDLVNYVKRAVAEPIPLTPDAQKILAASPTIMSPDLKLGTQEIAFVTDFGFELQGQQQGIDVSGIKVAGNIDVRLYPELITNPSKNTLAVRLRPTVSAATVCDLDLSKSHHPVLYWFERRKLLSAVINAALKAFRDNLNGQLHLDVPLPLAPIVVGRKPEDNGKDGVAIQPATLAAIEPQVTAGVVRISSKGLTLVTQLSTQILDPDQLPKPQPPPPLSPEVTPDQASNEVIVREFSKVNETVDALITKAFGSLDTNNNIAAIKKAFLSDSFNRAFNAKRIEINYSGKLDEQKPQSDDDRSLKLPQQLDLHCDQLANLSCDPRGTCTSFLLNKANDELARHRGICNTASSALNSALGIIGSACSAACIQVCGPFHIGCANVCAGDLVNPGACAAARERKAAQELVLKTCGVAIDATTAFLNAPNTLAKGFADSIGLGKFYSNVCSYYDKVLNVPQCKVLKAAWDAGCGTVQGALNTFAAGKKIADIDWRVSGVGTDAVKGQATLTSTTISSAMDSVQINGVHANASLQVEGWVKITPEPAFLPICPPPPCTVLGGDCHINLSPTTISAESANPTLSGTFGIAPFHDEATNLDRNAFFIKPDSFDVKVTTNVAPIGKLLRDNALSLPCSFNGVAWSTYAIAELISFTGIDLTITRGIDIKNTRIGWADSKVELPVSWNRDNENPTVQKSVDLHVQYSFSPSAVQLTADHIQAPPPTSSVTFVQRPLVEVAAGLSTGIVFARQAAPANGSSSDVFASAVNLYTTLNYRSHLFGGFISYTPGPSVTDFGVGMGVAVRPLKKFDRLTLLPGVRLGQVSKPTESGPRFMLGIGVDLGRLTLRGCKK